MRISGIGNFYNVPKQVGFNGVLKFVDRTNVDGHTIENNIYYPFDDEPEEYTNEILSRYNTDEAKHVAETKGDKTTYYEVRTIPGSRLPFTKKDWASLLEL